ncbi:MAG TPA: ATP synthase F1 subunit gamma [Tepidisphaeraceae bacterium]|nr:ATP synthase F1 subunit gamma [Tepidisphaeraceae bacterium]
MAKARAILKRRKAVRNIKKITKTMQMIATAKFQKSLKRTVATKPYTMKVRELVAEVARSVEGADHPLLRVAEKPKRVALIVIAGNRGLAGAYNGNVLRRASLFLREMKAAGIEVDVYAVGKRAASFFKFAKIPFKPTNPISDQVAYDEIEPMAAQVMERFISEEYDGVSVASMNFISTGLQKPEITTLLPMSGLAEAADRMGLDMAQREAQMKAGMLDSRRVATDVAAESVKPTTTSAYEFIPSAEEILSELLPLTIKTALFQSFLDAFTSEHVARMIAMKSATDAADKMAKALSLEANRARQTQITTELSEIMGGVEAMK